MGRCTNCARRCGPTGFADSRAPRTCAAARSVRIPFATAASVDVAGSKTKARSLRAPSPLMSDPTTGVKGTPEVTLPIALTSSARVMGSVTVPTSA